MCIDNLPFWAYNEYVLFRQMSTSEAIMNNLIKVKPGLTKSDIGQIANDFARQSVFDDYRTRKAKNTIKRQDSDLALFSDFLNTLGANCHGDFSQAESWDCVTWGLVEAFVKWQLNEGYSVSSINVRLSTIKTYAKLAVKAGTLDIEQYAMIKMISSYSRKEAKNIDTNRKEANIATRYDKPSIKKDGTEGKIGTKKAQHTSISKAQATQLKLHPDTPQGRRDKLLICLLLDHGLRCGEVASLTVSNLNIQTGELKFYRSKVDKEQTHKLTLETWQAAKAYLENDNTTGKALLLGSHKGGKLTSKGMSERAITKRVKILGETVGIDRLSAHDCRHYAATYYAKIKSMNELMEIFGWNSPAMAIRYIEESKVIELE